MQSIDFCVKFGPTYNFIVLTPATILSQALVNVPLFVLIVKSGERKVVRERTGVLSRPFQKLPPPFDLNEHHNMHG